MGPMAVAENTTTGFTGLVTMPTTPNSAEPMPAAGHTPALRRYRRMAWITLAAVYLLIVVGSSVRASGAGMGCPDWPTCFGRWIPPVSEAQLPADYQQTYAHLGYAEARFSATKTWTEYGNRLLGVTIGLLIMLTAVFSWPCRAFNRHITAASVAAFFMVALQGWLGAKVVGSNLQPGMITLHTLMALAIVGTLLYGLAQARRGLVADETSTIGPQLAESASQRKRGLVMGTTLTGPQPAESASHHKPGLAMGMTLTVTHLRGWLGAALLLTLIQVALGTQVREMTDFIAKAQGEALRAVWIEAMPWFYFVHRSFSIAVLALNLWLAWLLFNALGLRHTLTRLLLTAVGVGVLTVLSGATLGHLGMPALVQPAHLLAASLLFGLQLLAWLSLLLSGPRRDYMGG